MMAYRETKDRMGSEERQALLDHRVSQDFLVELVPPERKENLDLLDLEVLLVLTETMVLRVWMGFLEVLARLGCLDRRDKMVLPEFLDLEENAEIRVHEAQLARQALLDKLECRDPLDLGDQSG